MTSSVGKKAAVLVIFGLVILAGTSLLSLKRAGAIAKTQEQAGALRSARAQGAGSNSVAWHHQRIGISITGGQLRVILADLSSNTDYIVGVRSVDAQETGLIAGEIRFGGSGSKSIRPISQIVDWPRELIDVQPGVIRASGLSKAAGSVLIYVTVAAGTEVSIDTPDRTIARATLGNGLLIHNGIAIAEEVAGIRTLVSRLARPSPSPNAAQVVRIQGNQYVATPKGLAKNLISLRKPSCPTGITVAELEVVTLKVTIDETGTIKHVTSIRGTQVFVEAAMQAVKEWRFTPFSAENKAVPIVASIVFFFGPNGTVSSPVFDEMGK
ncbi:MAG: energy transducer TonB [Blastocatellia bacterium]